MAFVAISKDFMARVRSKVEAMATAEIKALGNEPVVTLNPRDPMVLNAVWKEHVHLEPLLPKAWISQNDEIRMKFKVPGSTFEKEERNFHGFKAKAAGSDKFVFPPQTWWHDVHECDSSNPSLATLVQYATSRKEIELRWHTVMGKVTQFLESCKSANEAVKLWPEVTTYFDKDDIERLEKKTARSGSADSKAAEVLAGIDTNEVMSAAVIARLSGAQV